MGNLIVIYGQCGTGDYYTTWPVCWAADDDSADRIIERLVLQSAAYHRRFQHWLTLPPGERIPSERIEAADAFKEKMLDRNFQETGGDARIPTTYYKRHIRPGPTRAVLDDLPDPDALTPVMPMPPRCSHMGDYRYYGQGTVLEARCDLEEGHASAHEPLCGGACCAAGRVVFERGM